MKVLKKHKHLVKKIEREDGLIDDCTHMVYLNDGYTLGDEYDSFPVKNKKELNEFLNDVEVKNNEKRK